jgi:anti-sigma B factor antagonist
VKLEEATLDGILLVKVKAARIDASVSGAFKDSLSKIAARSERVVLDLSAVDFVDSSGLGALVAGVKAAKVKKLAIAGARSQIVTLFRIARMDKVFGMYGSAAEAAAGMTS